MIAYPWLPVVTIPTTAGTGTEIAPFFVITNEQKKRERRFPEADALQHVAGAVCDRPIAHGDGSAGIHGASGG